MNNLVCNQFLHLGFDSELELLINTSLFVFGADLSQCVLLYLVVQLLILFHDRVLV